MRFDVRSLKIKVTLSLSPPATLRAIGSRTGKENHSNTFPVTLSLSKGDREGLPCLAAERDRFRLTFS